MSKLLYAIVVGFSGWILFSVFAQLVPMTGDLGAILKAIYVMLVIAFIVMMIGEYH
jgi:hypothetical protein